MPNGIPLQPPLLARPTQVRWLIFSLACATSWLLYLHRYAWGIIKPAFRKEYPGLSDQQIGWLDSAFLATYALGQVPGGMAGDRFGPRTTLSVLALVWSVAGAGVAWVSGFWPLAGARAAFGLAQAGVYPVLSKMTRIWLPRDSHLGPRDGDGPGTHRRGVRTGDYRHLVDGLARPFLADDVGGIDTARRVSGGGLLGGGPRQSARRHPWVNAAEQDLLDADSSSPRQVSGQRCSSKKARFSAWR